MLPAQHQIVDLFSPGGELRIYNVELLIKLRHSRVIGRISAQRALPRICVGLANAELSLLLFY